MPFEIEFHPIALSDWRALDNSVRIQFLKKLSKIVEHPRIDNSELVGDLQGCFKIKIHSTGHRMIYQILEDENVIYVIGVGRRDGGAAYERARQNLNS